MKANSFTTRPLIYIAAPYTNPDPVENTHMAIRVADRLHATGKVTCVVPHMSLLWQLIKPHDESYWYDYDLALLSRCDALLRLPGESPGATEEVRFCRFKDIPVFFNEHTLLSSLEWLSDV